MGYSYIIQKIAFYICGYLSDKVAEATLGIQDTTYRHFQVFDLQFEHF